MDGYDKYKGINSGVGIRVIETGDIFETRTRCAEALGVSVSSVSLCLSGRTHTCHGYHLEAVEINFVYDLTDDILDELYSLTGFVCEWREHPEIPNIYVSDVGIIAKNFRGNVYICNQHMNNSGYMVVSVRGKDSKKTENGNELVHRLVADTFIPNPYHKRFVNHIDGDKTNNCVGNLEWCTRSENMRHAVAHGLAKTERVIVVETGKEYNSSVECARDIGGTVSGIHDCKSGRQKRHRGYHFRFPNEEDEQ